jgi:alanine dehydrogenase
MSGPTFGLPCMHKEPGERRDFLPGFVRRLAALGAEVVLEEGYGTGMGFDAVDYGEHHSHICFAPQDEVYQQNYMLVLRYPSDDELRLMHPGACLITMVHYPTRPERVKYLRTLGIETISLDSLTDDTGRRLVENLRAVGWNGLEAGFQTLRKTYPDFEALQRPPIRVTVLGAGAVGLHAIQAAARYGNPELWHEMAEAQVPGVLVTAVEYDTTRFESVMRPLLAASEILVDATQRPDPSQAVIPNSWIGDMPDHAVLVDLSVDPYKCDDNPPTVKGIEGMPQGSLDQYVFAPDDPAFDRIPGCIETTHRRASVSCYSWPGIHPRECMDLYGNQLFPIIRRLIEAGGPSQIRPKGGYFQRAIARALLSLWSGQPDQPGAINGHT